MNGILKKDTNRNYNMLFVRPEQESIEIQKYIWKIISASNNEENRVKKALRESIGNGVEFYDDSYLLDLLSFVYSKDNEDIKGAILGMIKSFRYVKCITKTDCFMKIETDDGFIECMAISDFIKNGGKDKQNIVLRDLCNSIESMKDRQSKCHNFSIIASEQFKKIFNIDNSIITGFVRYYVPENKYLHSWIELKIDGKDFVFDFTKNIVIDKKSYYRLLHIDKGEICSIIESEKIIDDKKSFGKIINLLDFKTYLTSRDEIIRDLSKNKSHFNNSDIDCGEVR